MWNLKHSSILFYSIVPHFVCWQIIVNQFHQHFINHINQTWISIQFSACKVENMQFTMNQKPMEVIVAPNLTKIKDGLYWNIREIQVNQHLFAFSCCQILRTSQELNLMLLFLHTNFLFSGTFLLPLALYVVSV